MPMLTARLCFEKQVVQNEAKIGLAGTMVGQCDVGSAVVAKFEQQLFDELKQVINLLELAPRILVKPAFAGQDVKFLEQLQRLPRADIVCQRMGCGMADKGLNRRVWVDAWGDDAMTGVLGLLAVKRRANLFFR